MSAIHWFVTEVDPKNAGYRIRTMPLVAELQAQGVDVEVHATADLADLVKTLAGTALAVIVSKPADSLTFLCLAHLRASGVPVCVDLFDNYFSWSPALFKRQIHWQWICALKSASLVMTSSDFLRQVVKSLTDKPVVQVGDLVTPPASGRLEMERLEEKWGAPKRIELLWFGIAGNPYYSAGLEDLVRWSELIHTLARRVDSRVSIALTICTNRVPSVDAVLNTMRSHQIETSYVEWSESRCDELLADSHVVLLPTSLSGFSLSKTHNRCSDALASGCLVLTSPNGPYMGLGGAVFDDPEILATALGRITPSGVLAAIDASYGRLRQQNDIRLDVERLRIALHGCTEQRPGGSDDAPPVLIAARTSSETPKLSRTMGYLVAGFADGPITLNFDFKLEAMEGFGGLPTFTLSERAYKSLDRMLRRRRTRRAKVADHIECHIDGWNLRLHDNPRRIAVVSGLPGSSVQSLEEQQAQGRRGTMTQQSPWLDAHVDVLTRVLSHLGFSRMELAIEEAGGWESFARNTDPELASIASRLNDHWNRYFGREVAWGRPHEAAR